MAASWDGKLSTGVVEKMTVSTQLQEQAVVQVLELKPVESKDPKSGTRYKATIWDGKESKSLIFASQLSPQCQDGHFPPNCVVRLDQCISSSAPDPSTRLWFAIRVTRLATPDAPINGGPGASAPAAAAAPVAAPRAAAAPVAKYSSNAVKPEQHRANNAPPSAAPTRITPIAALNEFIPNNWTIQARVTSKGEIKNFTSKNNGSPGQLFSFTLVDSEGGDIRCTAFGNAVTTYFPIIETGKVYYLSKAQVKLANKRFSGNINHDYELTLDHNTIVKPCLDDTSSIPTVRYEFVPIAGVENCQPQDMIDVFGVIVSFEPLSDIPSKTGVKLIKRQLVIADNSGASIALTLWNKTAETFPESASSIAVKGVKVGDYGGRTLSAVSHSVIEYDPDNEYSHEVIGWWNSGGSTSALRALSQTRTRNERGGESGGNKSYPPKFFGEISADGPLTGDTKIFFSDVATISYIKADGNFTFSACPTCNKKTSNTDQGWLCDNPNCAATEKYTSQAHYRFILNLTALDHTGMCYLSAFDDVSQKLLGYTATEVMAEREAGNEAKVNYIFQDALFKKYKFQMLAKADQYQDKSRTRTNILKAEPVDFDTDAHELIARIEQLLAH